MPFFPAIATQAATATGITVAAGGLDTGEAVITDQESVVERRSVFGRIGETLGGAVNGFIERAAQIGTDVFAASFDPAFKLAQKQFAASQQPAPAPPPSGPSIGAGTVLAIGGVALAAALVLGR